MTKLKKFIFIFILYKWKMKSLCRFAANRFSDTLTPFSRQTISHLRFSSFQNSTQSTYSSNSYFSVSISQSSFVPNFKISFFGFPSIQWCPFQGSQFKTIAQDPYSSFPFFYSRVHTQTPIPEHSVSRGVLSKAHISKIGTNSFPIEFSFAILRSTPSFKEQSF